MILKELREKVCYQNKELKNNNLVLWTSGNVSARDKKTGYMVIKPSGVLFDDLTPEDIVVLDMKGSIVEGKCKPSVDTRSHLYIYNHMPEVNGIVHTHSPYATSFAITGEPLDVYTTTAAAVFGCQVPISDFVTIGEEEIGKEVVNKIGACSAILIRNHGVFTIGNSSEAALKSAVVLEENAQYVHYAMCRQNVTPLSADNVKRGYNTYHTTYGQNAVIDLLEEKS